MYGDLGHTSLFGLGFKAVDKEWLVKGAKEAEERTLGINAAGSSKSKKETGHQGHQISKYNATPRRLRERLWEEGE